MGVACAGRQRSTPGSGENVAFTSLITVAFSTFASRVAGSTSANSRRQSSIISVRDRGTRSYEALITNCKYCPSSALTFSTRTSAATAPSLCPVGRTFEPFVSIPLESSVRLKIHCVVWSSSVRNGSVITVRSNQKCTLVIGDVLICHNPSSGAPGSAISLGVRLSRTSCGTAAMHASASISLPSSRIAAAKLSPCTHSLRTPQRTRTSPPRFAMASRQPPYSSASGTEGIPTRYPSALLRKPFQKTSIPYFASVRASSSSSALTNTTRQNRSIAPVVWRIECSQSSIVAPCGYGGFPPARAIASIAPAIERLSASVSASNNKNDGAMCSGGGSGEA